MNRRRLIIILVIVFIGINGLLVYLDDEGKIARTSYIEEWSITFKKDMAETIETAGILATVNKKHVFFDADRGSFQEFLVEEGTKVDVGDQLFTYEVLDYYDTQAYLNSERSKLSGEISAIEQAIAAMSTYSIPQTDLAAQFKDNDTNFELTHQPAEIKYMKEEYLAEKKKELAQKNAQLKSIQAQLSELQSTGDTITVESPFQGEIIKLSETLTNPIVTVRDLQLQVEGQLTEKERTEIEIEMPIKIRVKESGTVLQGSFTKISNVPKSINLHATSSYPFEVSFKEAADTKELLPGLHANLVITTEESLGATVAKEKQIFDKKLWKMTGKGILREQNVNTGIHTNGVYEITKGADPGEWVAEESKSQFRDGATFITPLQLGDIQWKRLGKYDNVSWKKYFFTGMLSR